MKTKHLIPVALAGLALGGALWLRAADAAGAPAAASKGGPGPMVDMMAEKLGLSSDQKAKADDIMQKQRTALEALHNNKDLSPEQRRDKARELMTSTRDQMKALLTPEQQKKAEELRGQVRERWAGPGGPGHRKHMGMERRGPMGPHGRMGFAPGGQHGGPGRHGMMQGGPQNPMRTLMMAEQIKDRMAEKLGLSEEQRAKMEKMGREFRAAQRDAVKQHREAMRAVLTPEQQKKADEMKEHFMRGGPGKLRGPHGGGPNARPDDGGWGDGDMDDMDDADFDADDAEN
jgi:Spy/CpxP family protein refolding chaperone